MMLLKLFFTLAALTILTAGRPTAQQLKRDEPSSEAVINAINTWRNDAEKINRFLNAFVTTGSLNFFDIAGPLNGAKDEVNQLATLKALGKTDLGDKGQSAADQLALSINNELKVRRKLEEIRDRTEEAGHGPESRAIDIIRERCCHVIPFLGDLWTSAATVSGVIPDVDVTVDLDPTFCSATIPDSITPLVPAGCVGV
ncbi:hypothetical protein BDV96DRAFT_572184 [Lophiotrema nucula]|uniref:Hydrophobic surface binding protein A-domain-containing protein n=1 Tax=Lophiotrema nucula TaxID=690887 RepID=A0A6A5ZFH5_9PLEO|nr:hypothetical protein BDV96DRAFT_572184 [Lophiotrema nucula]